MGGGSPRAGSTGCTTPRSSTPTLLHDPSAPSVIPGRQEAMRSPKRLSASTARRPSARRWQYSSEPACGTRHRPPAPPSVDRHRAARATLGISSRRRVKLRESQVVAVEEIASDTRNLAAQRPDIRRRLRKGSVCFS